jgi:fructose-1-phosphate kinase PfkB-like protein
LTNEGILNDFVRIRGESRTSTAVLDPTSNVYTEINEWGPEVSEDELDVLREKLAYLSQGAAYVVFAGSLPRDVDPGLYAELIREGNRRGLMTVLDSEGEALRLGSRPSRTSSRPICARPSPWWGTSSSTRKTSRAPSTRSPTSARGTS